MSNRAQELIKTYYEEELLRKETEITFADFSLRLNSSDIAMLEVIAKRFGKAPERIASEAVSAAIYSMVEALETAERKNMAKEADELNESLAKKAARANGNPDFDEKSVTWVMNDRAITREENKRKKEVEENIKTDDEPEPSDVIESASTIQAETSSEQSMETKISTPHSVFAS